MQELNQALEPDPLAVWVELEKKIDLQHINPSFCYFAPFEAFVLQLLMISTGHVSTESIYYPNCLQLAVLDK